LRREFSEETLGILFGGCTADSHSVLQSTRVLLDLLRGTSSMCTVLKLKKARVT
jgi:hypothetical protein